MHKSIRVLVVGCGNMGASHAKAYEMLAGFEIVGLVSRGNSNARLNRELKGEYPLFDCYETALLATSPDAVCISTYPDTHESYTIQAFEYGAHVFVEKPLAEDIAAADRVIAAANRYGKKLVVGYILRYHPSWKKFISVAQTLGKPLVMRMNLNQQSHGYMWNVHRNLMQTLSPIVDCGVHYIDVMCQMTGARPVSVSAIGARLTADIPDWNYNYGQLQIRFEDGSVGWYEAGWGPMISQNAFFIKDVFGPKGGVSIVADKAAGEGQSDSVAAHTKTERLKVHRADLDPENNFVGEDQWIELADEPDHQALCAREQLFFQRAIREDLDLQQTYADALNSLRIALACDESVKTGRIIHL